MYLSSREHDQLRTIVMGFEVPFRTFIARRLTSVYNSEAAFSVALNNAIIPPDSPVFVASEMGKIRANTAHYYKVLLDTVQACNLKCVPNEIDVPYVATLITLYLVFENTIRDYLSGFPNHSLYVDYLDKYKYARNKLDHPQSLTLQEDNMYPVLSLVKDAITAIYIIDDECFWEKSEEEIENEVIALETKVRKNPIEVNNFSIIPFSDNSIVCRQHQIDKVLSFVYGKPGTLKKKSSLSIFGYGGVGKTAIVTEAIRIIVRDILDNRTINGYLPKFILFYSAKKTKLIIDDLVVIKINQSYYEGISAEALYDYTRGIWKRSIKTVSAADYALSVVYGIVVEVYKIDRWMPATETVFTARKVDSKRAAERVAFEGRVAKDSIRNKYIGKSVAYLFENGAANPCVSFSKYSSPELTSGKKNLSNISGEV